MNPSDLIAHAVVSASAYGSEHSATATEAPFPAEVLTEIRRARLYLYCGQGADAIAEIRSARDHLRRCAPEHQAIALHALDAASWLARHGHTGQAEGALEAALARLDPTGISS